MLIGTSKFWIRSARKYAHQTDSIICYVGYDIPPCRYDWLTPERRKSVKTRLNMISYYYCTPLLNGIATEIAGMKDLYELGDLKERDVDKFLEEERRLDKEP